MNVVSQPDWMKNSFLIQNIEGEELASTGAFVRKPLVKIPGHIWQLAAAAAKNLIASQKQR